MLAGERMIEAVARATGLDPLTVRKRKQNRSRAAYRLTPLPARRASRNCVRATNHGRVPAMTSFFVLDGGSKGTVREMVPTTPTLVPPRAFCLRGDIIDVVVPEGVTEIGEEAFKDCSSLASVTLPHTLVRVARKAFKGCTALRSVVLPHGVRTIGEKAFKARTN